MKHESLRRGMVSSLSTLLLAILLVAPAAAQEPAAKAAAEPSKPPAITPQKEVKKPRGRLPAYYGKVVSEKQREEIYLIQAKYNEQIDKLKEQLETLTTQRNGEVEQVLTDEQRAEVARLQAARRSRSRSSSSDEESSADSSR